MTSNISIIIPALNEEAGLAGLAPMLSSSRVLEIILVDGGSTDQTVPLARDLGFTVVAGKRGRARQMNEGAARGAGDILLFLHADTVLPDNFAEVIISSLADKATAVCAFSLEIQTDKSLLKVVAGLANIRSRLLKLPYGDQAIAMRAELFNALGGYPELPIMEDYELVRKAGRFGKVVTLPERAVTSDRRWKKYGIIQTTLINQLVVLGFKAGIAPEKLLSLYRQGLFRRN